MKYTRTIIITAALLITALTFLPAQESINFPALTNELTEASTLTDSQTRLEKYDSILVRYGIRKETTSNQSESKWDISVDTDPLDDSKKIVFLLVADSGESEYGSPIYLIIRYAGNKTELIVNWNDYLGSEAYVTMRVGTEKASTREWSMSTTSKATFYPGNTVELIRTIMDSDQLVLQCTPYSSNPVTAIFDTTGLRTVAADFMTELKW